MVDYGDCHFDFGVPESVPKYIEDHISGILDEGSAVFSIGGDHFVSYPILQISFPLHIEARHQAYNAN